MRVISFALNRSNPDYSVCAFHSTDRPTFVRSAFIIYQGFDKSMASASLQDRNLQGSSRSGFVPLFPAEKGLSPLVDRDAAGVSHAADAEIVVVGSSGDDDFHLVRALEIFLSVRRGRRFKSYHPDQSIKKEATPFGHEADVRAPRHVCLRPEALLRPTRMERLLAT